MNTFVVCRSEDHAERARTLAARLKKLGVDLEVFEQNAIFTVLVSARGVPSHRGNERFDGAGFIICSGVFGFNGEHGSAALRQFYNRFDSQKITLSDTRGTFALAICKHGALWLVADELGTYKIYHDRGRTVFSNSFLVVAEAATNPSINVQACYEYTWNGGEYGERTFFNEIGFVPFSHAVLVSDAPEFRPLSVRDYREPDAGDKQLDELIELHLDRCRAVFRDYARWFGNQITLSLSGGYDSRLLLALLLDAGVRPHVFTYGREQDLDCQIARGVASGENLTFQQVDKSQRAAIPVSEYGEQLLRNYAAFDGWKNTGLFDNGEDLVDREARVRGGMVKMNGGGGEIYRNFFYLLERSYTPRAIVRSFYSRYSPAACTESFNCDTYEKGISDAICAAIGVRDRPLSRPEVELIYPLFRNRYWTARVQAENHAFGPCLLPFLEPALFRGTCDVPIKFKSYGRFEGAMIKSLNPRLAAYPTSYGYSLEAPPPPAYQLKAQLTYLRPTFLRKYSYRLQHRQRERLPYFLTDQYLRSVIDIGFPYMSRLFRIEAINDPEVLNRIATIEFICQRLSARDVLSEDVHG